MCSVRSMDNRKAAKRRIRGGFKQTSAGNTCARLNGPALEDGWQYKEREV